MVPACPMVAPLLSLSSFESVSTDTRSSTCSGHDRPPELRVLNCFHTTYALGRISLDKAEAVRYLGTGKFTMPDQMRAWGDDGGAPKRPCLLVRRCQSNSWRSARGARCRWKINSPSTTISPPRSHAGRAAGERRLVLAHRLEKELCPSEGGVDALPVFYTSQTFSV